MSTLTAVCAEEQALQEEYKAALQTWAEVRAADPHTAVSPAIVEVSRKLDAVELKLKNHRIQHGC